MKIANREAHHYSSLTVEFQGHNLIGTWINPDWYVVYSYGNHWPVWAFDRVKDIWYENVSKYSVTTSKHKTQSNPGVMRYTQVDVNELKFILEAWYANIKQTA